METTKTRYQVTYYTHQGALWAVKTYTTKHGMRRGRDRQDNAYGGYLRTKVVEVRQ